MKPYEGKNGLTRNWLRAKYEWQLFRDHLKAQPKSHDPITNYFVEMCRAAPWLAGHLWLYSLVTLGGVAIYGILSNGTGAIQGIYGS